MRFIQKLLSLIAIIIFSQIYFASAQNSSNDLTGTLLCDDMYSFLKKNKISASPQYLVNSGENEFPYNILINNSSEKNIENLENHKLIFIFEIEEISKSHEILLELNDKLSEQDFNSTILLVYGSNDRYPGLHSINSTDIYLENLNENDNNIIYNIRLNEENNKIITGTKGFASPSWMVQEIYNSFTSCNLDFNFPFLYISQMSKASFDSDQILFTLLKNDFSAVTIYFAEKQKSENAILNVLEYLIDNFDLTKNSEPDYHSLMLTFGKKTVWLSELTIMKIIIAIVLISLAFIFIIGYINIHLKNEAWIQLKKSWYILVVTSVITIIGFLAGRGLYLLFTRNNFEKTSVYGILVLQFCITMILLSGYFFLEMLLHKQRYSGKSIDLLTLLITFLNQFIFCFVDISLFPIFFSICIFAILSWFFNKNIGHIILFILMLILLFAYTTVLLQNSNPFTLKLFLINSNFLPFVLSFILLPIFMMWLSILTAIRTKFDSVKIAGIIIGIFCGFIILVMILFNVIIFSKYNSNQPFITFYEKSDEDYNYNLEYKDKYIFGELIRTINISSEIAPEFIQLTIEGKEAVPVLYSDQDYSILTNKIAAVDLPSFPGKNISFAYGSAGNKEVIELKLIYPGQSDVEKDLIVKSIETEVINDSK